MPTVIEADGALSVVPIDRERIPASIVKLPVLFKLPVVENVAFIRDTEATAVGRQTGDRGDRRPGPVERDAFPWLMVMLVPLGNANVAPGAGVPGSAGEDVTG